MYKPLGLLFACVALALPSASHAHEPRYNEVEFQTEVSREVQNDEMHATLYAEFNESNPAQLGARLTRVANDAMRAAKEHKAVQVSTGSNQTYPVYDDKNKLVGWRGRTEVRLHSKDFAAASALIAALQPNMHLAGVHFGVSPQLRRATEEELMKEAIGAFRARAELLRHALGGHGYKLRRLNVNTGGGISPVMEHRGRASVAMMKADAPEFEAGKSQIQVTANGLIEVEDRNASTRAEVD